MGEQVAAGGVQRTELDADSLRGAHVLWIARDGADRRPLSELPDLLGRTDGLVWLDVPRCQTDTSVALEALFGSTRSRFATRVVATTSRRRRRSTTTPS